MAKIQGKHIPASPKNLAINGALDFWQEKAGTTTTVNTATSQNPYSSDMFLTISSGSTVKNYSIVRSTDVPSFSQAGFNAPYSMLYTQLTGIPSFAANDVVIPQTYFMEGLDYSQIHGKKVTYGFWVKASMAGTYSFSLRNAAANRSYVTTFQVNGANTHEFKTITISMDSGGTWVFDNNRSLIVSMAACGGTDWQTATLNQWQTGNYTVASTAANFIATTNATIRFSMFSIVEGPLGFGPQGFSRAGNSIEDELAMCQRYLYVGSFAGGCVCDSSALIVTNSPCELPVPLRTVPSYSAANFSGMSFSGVGNGAGLFDTPLTFSAQISSTVNYFQVRTNNPNARATGITGTIAGTVIADARL